MNEGGVHRVCEGGYKDAYVPFSAKTHVSHCAVTACIGINIFNIKDEQ